MYKKQVVELSEVALPVRIIEHRLRSARQALIAVAGREEALFETVRSSLRAAEGYVAPPLRVLVLCDRISRETVASHQEPPPSGMEICVVDEVPVQFAVFDQESAFTLTNAAPVEVRGGVAIESLMNFFESLWRRGQLLPKSSDPGADGVKWADDVQLAIMKRLVNGDTEDKIGRSLGMSRRTVAAHVARISRRLGSTSRTQLGYLIAQGNFLDPFDPSDFLLVSE
ncbi:LuxR C-terminal-related transcriptional regulator [Streptomyces sp. NBC_01231]|nr:LuxR C-terminal-related transcriptional regulator [Streptomyces sp. NBC_01231]